MTTRVHKPEKHPTTGMWWIPPLIPHWDDWMGPYSDFHDAKGDCDGIERTINGNEWKMMMLEAEEDFEDMWEERERLYAHSLRSVQT